MATVNLPDPVFAKLSAHAEATGMSVDQFALALLNLVMRQLRPLPNDEENSTSAEAAAAQVDRYPQRSQVDDSRETIYKERLDRQR
jgi:hypothetical protein